MIGSLRTFAVGGLLAALAVVHAGSGTLGGPRALAAPRASAAPHWVASFSAPALSPGQLGASVPARGGTGGRTVRDVVHLTLGGSRIRVRLSNVFGTQSATFTDVRVAVAAAAAQPATRPGSSRRVRFGGSERVTVAPGAVVSSDPVGLQVRAGQNLAISIYAPRATGTATLGGSLNHTNYLSADGDASAATSAARFGVRSPAWYWLAGVDVVPVAAHAGAIVALGDSITAGFDSTPNAGRGWTDLLADRLRVANMPDAVLDAGISGNTLTQSSPCFGQSGLDRLGRDALAQPGVRAVIVADGVNDITEPHESGSACLVHKPVSAAQLIAAYRVAIGRIHARGLEAIGATITPFGRYSAWTPAIESERDQINHWIRTSGAFDGVIDFDRAVRDPGRPDWLRPVYDSGDGLHPNDAGHAAMARAIRLSLFAGP